MPFLANNVAIADYLYDLPQSSIAERPLAIRDTSKLLLWKETVSDYHFYDLPTLLPPNAHLFFNDTKVVQARLLFKRDTGALIEIFCLEPVAPFVEMQQAMQTTGTCTWRCMIGNGKRWKNKECLTISHQGFILNAFRNETDTALVDFYWEPSNVTFAEILNSFGKIPLPPYLNREPEQNDYHRYQTVYAQNEGAVAAPTAGLHFTTSVFDALHAKGITTHALTLHVGAGTFKPVTAQTMAEHDMHPEMLLLEPRLVQTLIDTMGPIVAVGTTSMRTLESIYWIGLKWMQTNAETPPELDQWFPYQNVENLNYKTVLNWLLNKMQGKTWQVKTSLLIMPGYQFKFCDALITNFHQPGSTLMLLVAALIGDSWKNVYQHALEKRYRFLSYGDSSLLWKNNA